MISVNLRFHRGTYEHGPLKIALKSCCLTAIQVCIVAPRKERDKEKDAEIKSKTRDQRFLLTDGLFTQGI